MGSVRVGIGILGIVALGVAVAVTRYDGFNQGGGARYKAPRADRELVFKVKIRRYLVLGKYDDPRSPTVHWAVNNATGSEAPRNTDWSRSAGKLPAGTYFSLYVQPGLNAATVATQEVTVIWGGVVVCGPTEEHGSGIPRCEGTTT